uniref:histidine kinase n=1 Tax=uncultured bacterium r_02 TaxID=1132277 RepID=I6YTD8_9BACT|nr:histidine kinase [uncultured bacterium r_02]
MEQNEREVLLQKFADVNRKLKLANEQLEIANKKLKEYEEKALRAEKASQMKSLFLANMSHEIRTPLNAIEGFSRVIAETDSEEERLRYYQIIESNNQRLTSLINDILDLSRVESGEVVIRKTSTDLDELCQGVLQMFKFRIPEGVKFEWDKPLMSATMNTDGNRLIQVFSNLISNALKHTQKGSIVFGYRLIEESQKIEFYVKDTGTGIAPEFLPHIFDIYASKDAEQQKGFGLGLALCKIIVEKLGGKISVDSVEGQGSTFVVTLPFEGTVGGVNMEHTTTTTNVRTIRVSERPLNTMKTILVAEDEDSNFDLVKAVLQKRYRLLRAHNGIEAVNLNEDEHPDLILMDIRMPEMNGLDATRIIKEISHDTPVIALSAYAFEENIREARLAGFDEFMSKPFRVESLIEMVSKYID